MGGSRRKEEGSVQYIQMGAITAYLRVHATMGAARTGHGVRVHIHLRVYSS